VRFCFLVLLALVTLSDGRQISWWYVPDNVTDVPNAVAVIRSHVLVFSTVMLYCGHNVAPNGSMVFLPGFYCNGPDGIIPSLRMMGVGVELWLGTPDDDNVDSFRAAFANPEPMMNSLVSVATQWNISGWNIDWEPGTSTAADCAAFRGFLVKLRPRLHAIGVRLTIDVADWSPMLNDYQLLQDSVDRMLDMETYNGDSYSQWLGWYSNIVNTKVNRTTVGVGLGCWVDHDTNNTWAITEESVVQRLTKISSDGIVELDMFRLLPSVNWPEPFWWAHLAGWIAS